ncbi:hypothetical protein F2Q68_00033783 [Brassica cretica]|uniref:OCRE domain-containing protein n=2 Tax=Brassica cretica TaxID=69181 RepID=A0ABQ7E3U1_BRACR|nr:hypothetical protein F2Q68_00033783 [Brassica cretica]KAF3591096.1 hypothetical protein DY000_02021043 [Brassica cretica]
MQRCDETNRKQIRKKQKLLGEEHISAIRSTELFLHRSTSILQHRSTSTIQHRSTSVQNQNPLDPDGYAKAMDGHTLHVSREDIADIHMQQRTITEHQQRVTKEFYDTADRRPKFGRRAFDLFGTRKFYWEEKDEYGIYKDDQGYARDVDGHTIYRNTSGKNFER